MTKRTHRGLSRVEIIALVGGILALNIAAAVIYRLRSKAPSTEAPVAAPVAPVPTPDEAKESARFKALRSAGLTALAAGQYPKAVESFTEALKYGRADSDIIGLLKMANEFKEAQERGQGGAEAAGKEPEPEPARPEPAEPAPAPAPERPRPVVAKRPPPRPAPARRPEPAREPRPEPEAPTAEVQRGSVLVTSTPSGLVVEIDGARRDLTPAKVVLPAGTHNISIFKGTARLFQRMVEVEADQVALVDADLSSALAPAPARPAAEPEPAREPPPAPREPPAAPPTPAPREAPAAAVVPPAPVAPAGPETGELQIESLNVYGEVYVNDVSVGFPPVVAKRIPPGPAVVEVRVDGAVRRKRSVEVVANKRTTVRIP